MKKVLCIGGSPRKGGNTDIIIEHIVDGIKENGVSAETVLLRDYTFRSCIGCERCRKDKTCTGLQDDMQMLYPKILESTGFVLFSPVYNHSFTAPVKAFIDRMYCFYDFSEPRPGNWSSRVSGQERKALIGAVAEQNTIHDSGIDLTLELMRIAVTDLGYNIVAELPVLGIFDRGKVRDYPDILVKARDLGARLAVNL